MRGAALNKLAAALSGARLAKNSPTALCVRAAADAVLVGALAARVNSGVILSSGHRAFAAFSAFWYRGGSKAYFAAAIAALAINGGRWYAAQSGTNGTPRRGSLLLIIVALAPNPIPKISVSGFRACHSLPPAERVASRFISARSPRMAEQPKLSDLSPLRVTDKKTKNFSNTSFR